MAKTLSRLLGAKEPMFSIALRELEAMTGNKGIDVAYIADVLHRAHALMRVIGLDPADTTEQELYKALESRAEDEALFHNMADVGLIFGGTQVISFNLEDVRANTHKLFDNRELTQLRHEMVSALLERYEIASGESERVTATAAQAGLIKQDSVLVTDEPKKIEVKQGESMPNILCIGDIFTDAFIQLPEGSAKVIKEEDGKEWLALPFGQKPPYDHVDIVRSVGPSPNSAVSMSRLGVNASLMAWIGGDDTGKEALAHLAEERIDTSSMVTEPENKTSYWYVLRYGADRTMLVRSEKYKYEWRDPEVKPDWIYLSYIGELAWDLHEKLLDYLQRNPDVKLAFQPGTFHFQWGVEKLASIYGRSEIVVMNREEAVDVTGASYENLHELANALHNLGPKYVVITDGPKGSYASHDGKLVTIPNYPDPAPPLDRTGAGDAFASTIVAGLALGKDFETALTWAPINSMSVVQQMGAQAGLLTLPKLEEFLANAPADYEAKELN